MGHKRRIGLLLTLLVCGCFQRFLPIRAIETKDGVAFELSEVAEGLSSNGKYELLDLIVTRCECKSDCTMWFILSPLDAGSVHLTRARIAYGEAVPGSVVRTPVHSLTPARYSVSASVRKHGSRGELVRSLSMRGEFELSRDGSGKLRVTDRDESGKTGGCR
jgi:hypothetical protein